MIEKSALVVGAGGVLGAAVCAEFVRAGYRVVGLRRAAAADDAAGVRYVGCDLADPEATGRVASSVVAALGRVDVVVCNAAHLVIAPFGELSFEAFEESWRVSAGSAFAAARAVLPSMTARGQGALIVSGATGSRRGTARFAAFAAAKFALRGLTQSLSREYQPLGVHIAHVVLDGLLRGSASAARNEAPPDQCIDPAEVATIYRLLAEQEASAWTHELDLRPKSGRF
jgi:NAD(P)-dependent dehydrogenase (short-subunit alcohol dehydrogenase family)